MLRKIIEIDEAKCDGCGLCIPACPEGAIQLVEGKAKLVRDFYCDGLGACLGHCPQGAITVIEREAEEYDERQVIHNVMAQGDQVVRQHLQHLREHGETHYLNEALTILKETQEHKTGLEMLQMHSSCPGSQSLTFDRPAVASPGTAAEIPSSLSHWPVQMHLISPMAPHYRDSEVVLAADCVAFSMADFHHNYLKGKTLAIACPKLDTNQQVYLEKLKLLIDKAEIRALNVMIMQVPCCSGLLQLAKTALQQAQRKIPLKATVVGIRGEILDEKDYSAN
jgi:ferredoxin